MDFPERKSEIPVCKIGPGGDFTTVWPGQTMPFDEPPKTSLGKLLVTLSEIVNVVLGSEPSDRRPSRLAIYLHPDRIKGQQRAKDGVAGIFLPTMAPSGGVQVSKNDRRLSVHPWLFADDRPALRRAAHKSKNAFPSHRKTTRKKVVRRSSMQGTLFEVDFKRIRTA